MVTTAMDLPGYSAQRDKKTLPLSHSEAMQESILAIPWESIHMQPRAISTYTVNHHADKHGHGLGTKTYISAHGHSFPRAGGKHDCTRMRAEILVFLIDHENESTGARALQPGCNKLRSVILLHCDYTSEVHKISAAKPISSPP